MALTPKEEAELLAELYGAGGAVAISKWKVIVPGHRFPQLRPIPSGARTFIKNTSAPLPPHVQTMFRRNSRAQKAIGIVDMDAAAKFIRDVMGRSAELVSGDIRAAKLEAEAKAAAESAIDPNVIYTKPATEWEW